ncbi:MAG TPA: hypothetical protein VM782_09875, partial [Stellaceae bacterium]|nr:hypothetical protein [Stellaceae bacterium]
GDADGGSIPQIRAVELSDRHIEARAEPVFQAAHNLASIFDGLRGFDVKFESEESDGHPVLSSQFLLLRKTDN